MKYTMIAPVGDDNEAIIQAVEQLPMEQVILLQPGGEEVPELDVPVVVHRLAGADTKSVFSMVAQLKSLYAQENLLINGTSGTKEMCGLITCAAYAHDIQVVSIQNGIRMLPMLKFSYEEPVTEKKMRILKTLQEGKQTVEELAKAHGMSPPLVSFHMNGSRRSKGLLQMGLVRKRKVKGICNFSLSVLGELLLDGLVPVAAR